MIMTWTGWIGLNMVKVPVLFWLLRMVTDPKWMTTMMGLLQTAHDHAPFDQGTYEYITEGTRRCVRICSIVHVPGLVRNPMWIIRLRRPVDNCWVGKLADSCFSSFAWSMACSFESWSKKIELFLSINLAGQIRQTSQSDLSTFWLPLFDHVESVRFVFAVCKDSTRWTPSSRF